MPVILHYGNRYRNESVFYFTAFEGDKNCFLYYFYLACYKIYLSTSPALMASDKFPLQLSKNNITRWLQDIVSPFIIFSRLCYESVNKISSNDFLNPGIIIESKQILQFLSFKKITNRFAIEINNDQVKTFSFYKNKKQIKVVCTPKEF